ncbi:MAG: MerR family transcriptional regulator [Leptospiraceae bacterium]|nr:MerR family transcriptional regulator [Leptospiraceae bacterium]
MKYLIKDLSKMTGVKGFTIRKWQERYSIFNPQMASNGYWYYTQDDYVILGKIVKMIESGERISNIAAIGRDNLLKLKNDKQYSANERELLKYLSEGNLVAIEKYLESEFSKTSFRKFIRDTIETIIILAGRGWQDGLISVADESSFTRWMFGYLRNKCAIFESSEKPVWLVAVFPGDPHELGALMHYAMISSFGIRAKFVGSIPTEHLLRELHKSDYKAVSISMTLAQQMNKIDKLKANIEKKSKVRKISFGGRGFKLSKYGICRDK